MYNNSITITVYVYMYYSFTYCTHYLKEVIVISVNNREHFETKWMIAYRSGHHRHFITLQLGITMIYTDKHAQKHEYTHT